MVGCSHKFDDAHMAESGKMPWEKLPCRVVAREIFLKSGKQLAVGREPFSLPVQLLLFREGLSPQFHAPEPEMTNLKANQAVREEAITMPK